MVTIIQKDRLAAVFCLQMQGYQAALIWERKPSIS
jgi:hypothetical protein